MSGNDRPEGQPTPPRDTRAPATPNAAPHTAFDSAFLRACRREPVPHTPVWFMRQAGRSLPEYRKLREGIAMLDSCMRPDLVAEITLQPVRRHKVDAAIYFSDIVVPLKAIGVSTSTSSRASDPSSRSRSAAAPTWSGCGPWSPRTSDT